MRDQDFYEFIDDIMDDKGLLNSSRKLFWDDFAIKYINNPTFRYENKDKYILFNSDKYIGVVNSIKEARTLYPGKGRELFCIGDNKTENRFVLHTYEDVDDVNKDYCVIGIHHKISVMLLINILAFIFITMIMLLLSQIKTLLKSNIN